MYKRQLNLRSYTIAKRSCDFGLIQRQKTNLHLVTKGSPAGYGPMSGRNEVTSGQNTVTLSHLRHYNLVNPILSDACSLPPPTHSTREKRGPRRKARRLVTNLFAGAKRRRRRHCRGVCDIVIVSSGSGCRAKELYRVKYWTGKKVA